jgi:queuine tRNA-ribosyltransferase/7-cyano-7-deazaguanine tRNA-ribosyltransferase
VKITDDGVAFTSPIDGAKVFLGPKESIEIQQKLGADIIFAFDEATSPVADDAYTEKSLERTHRWAKQSLDAKTSDQALYGIVQGGKFKNLRKASAQFIGSLPFDGFGIGGEYGDDKSKMVDIITASLDELAAEKPRHLLGIGHLEDIPEIIKAGIDTFDCIVPTHYARHGTAFVSPVGTRLDLQQSRYLTDQSPLDPTCPCPVCSTYKRSYISHLVRAREITGLKLLTLHNLYFFNNYISSLRDRIRSGDL